MMVIVMVMVMLMGSPQRARITLRNARTASAMLKTKLLPCEGSRVCIASANMSMAQRQRHSCSSGKSTAAKSDDSSTSPSPSCATVCERRNAHRICGMEPLLTC